MVESELEAVEWSPGAGDGRRGAAAAAAAVACLPT